MKGKLERRHMKRKVLRTHRRRHHCCPSVPFFMSLCGDFKGRERARLHMKRVGLITTTSLKLLHECLRIIKNTQQHQDVKQEKLIKIKKQAQRLNDELEKKQRFRFFF